MKKPSWKSIAELIGILSIVVSLIYLNLQMRQSEKIAMAEHYSANNSATIELQAFLSQNADVWVRGKTDEPLSPAESAIFENLVREVGDSAVYRFLTMREMYGDDVAFKGPAVSGFASFLFDNPGARRVWEEREKRIIKNRTILNPDADDLSWWKDTIQGHLEKLDQIQSANESP